MTAALPPGPYKVTRGQKPPHHLVLYDADGSGVAMVFEQNPLLQNDPRALAVVRLFEQAPVLAELLVIALDEYEQHNGRRETGQHWSVEARICLDRAEGKRP